MTEGNELDRRMLSHQLRNTLSAIDMLLDYAQEEAGRGDDPRGTIAKARAGVEETLEIISRELDE